MHWEDKAILDGEVVFAGKGTIDPKIMREAADRAREYMRRHNMGDTAANIPTAEEMAKRSNDLLNKTIENIFARVIKQLDAASSFSATVTLKESEEGVSELIVDQLKELGYKVQYTPGHYEDRPCGGYVGGKLNLDWTPTKKRR